MHLSNVNILIYGVSQAIRCDLNVTHESKPYLVCPGSLGEEMPGSDPRVLSVTPLQLLDACPAKPLHKPALHLADIDRWIYWIAHIHDDVRPSQLHSV